MCSLTYNCGNIISYICSISCGIFLGTVRLSGQKYIFDPDGIALSSEHLRDIADFCEGLMEERKKKRPAYDFSAMSDLELVKMQHEVKKAGFAEDKEFRNAILVELGKRQKTWTNTGRN